MPRFSEKELDKLLETMPKDLKIAVFSEETAYSIQRICERNKIKEGTPQVATLVGNVLIGLSPLEEFPGKLQEALGIDKTKVKRITQEANRLIFFPVQKSLDQLYKKPGAPAKEEVSSKTGKAEPTKTQPQKSPSGDDSYRESIEE